MALILRAADDLRIVMARSLNSVFKKYRSIFVNTLSGKYFLRQHEKQNPIQAESRDKEIITETLQQMIKKINEY